MIISQVEGQRKIISQRKLNQTVQSDCVVRRNFLIVLENCLALCEEALIRIESGRALKRVEAVLLKDLSRRTVGKRLEPSERKLKADGACKFN